MKDKSKHTKQSRAGRRRRGSRRKRKPKRNLNRIGPKSCYQVVAKFKAFPASSTNFAGYGQIKGMGGEGSISNLLLATSVTSLRKSCKRLKTDSDCAV